jgi:hypothetical protein
MDQTVEVSEVAQSMEAEFLALICADDDLLRAEFDAIITAEWPTPPPRPRNYTRGRQRREGAGRSRHRSAARPSWLQDQPRRPGVGAWSRERSPPP